MLLNSNYRPSPQAMGELAANLDHTLLDEVSRQMASSNLSRRLSRGSNGPRIGGSMRVSKANSASNSPRNSTTLNRRKTVMGDGSYRRQPLVIDQGMVGDGCQTFDTPSQESLLSRPLSWHPSEYSAYNAQYQPTYQASTMDYNMPYSNHLELPNTPALLSNYGSPSLAFSPEPQPWASYEQEYAFNSDATSFMQPTFNNTMNDCNIYAPYQLPLATQTHDADFTNGMNPSIYSHFDWNSFAVNGFENVTAPPTPETFLPIQHTDPPCAVEHSIPYHSLDDNESEGEVLVGMGLYDAPEKSPLPDLQLDQYRSAMISQYLGSASRRVEPTGKGLKLEETWEPPVSEHEEEEEDQDGEIDADGSTADEDEQSSGQQSDGRVANNSDYAEKMRNLQQATQLHYGSHGEHDGWL